jgi:fimbrial chaperone protein
MTLSIHFQPRSPAIFRNMPRGFYLLALTLLVALFPPWGKNETVFAGEWRVSPIRLEFDRQAKSGVLMVINDGTEKLHVQVRAYEWTQDESGKDQYTESNDLIFFPHMMVLQKNEQRILRAGIRIPAALKEKTYRLFIEEIPGPQAGQGTNVTVAIRFGVPIFVKPLREEIKGVLDPVAIDQGVLRATARNLGNEHFVIHSLTVKGKDGRGKEIFAKELAGWYLLNGATRTYQTSIPAEVCLELKKVAVQMNTDKFNLDHLLDVQKEMCRPGK